MSNEKRGMTLRIKTSVNTLVIVFFKMTVKYQCECILTESDRLYLPFLGRQLRFPALVRHLTVDDKKQYEVVTVLILDYSLCIHQQPEYKKCYIQKLH